MSQIIFLKALHQKGYWSAIYTKELRTSGLKHYNNNVNFQSNK